MIDKGFAGNNLGNRTSQCEVSVSGRRKFTTLGGILLAVAVLLLWEHFADGSSKNISGHTVLFDRGAVSVYFSPRGGAENAIVSAIDDAHKTLDIAIYTFTSRPISQAVVRAHERGVKVRIIMDDDQARDRYSKYRYLKRRGIPIALYTGDGIMHNKFAVIDTQTVITGSFNWTASAEEYNYENLLIIDSPEVAKIYEDYFAKMWNKFR